MKEELIAPCGMNCAICSAHLAMKHDVKAKGVKMPYCEGCGPRDKKCAFLKKRCQLLMEGKVKFCYECDTFPCGNIQTIDKRYRKNYDMSLVENLEIIRDKGMKAFLTKERKKWRCPDCGGAICCHNGICFDCGLEKLKAKKKKYRREE